MQSFEYDERIQTSVSLSTIEFLEIWRLNEAAENETLINIEVGLVICING
jgi:hypothetical protein